MIFEGKVNSVGTVAKPAYKLSSRAFDVAKNVASATHLKIKGVNQFVEIKEDLIIKRKKDSSGNPTDNVVHYTEINPNEEFVCLIGDEEVAISPNFYAQIVLMNKNEKGHYLRCEDGTFIHESEVQAPAYKKVPIYGDVTLSSPVNNNQFYVEQEVIYVRDSANPKTLKKIVLDAETSKNVVKDGDKYFYIINGERVECFYKKNLETRKYIKHLLLDGDKIVDISKLKQKPNGDLVLEGIEGEDVVVGKKDVKLEQGKPFVEGSTMENVKHIMIPSNMLEQRQRIEQGLNLAFRWKAPTINGLVAIDINQSRTVAKFTYADGTIVVYRKQNVTYRNAKGVKVTEIVVDELDVVEVGMDNIKVKLEVAKNDIAKDLKFSPSTKKLVSYNVNGREISGIKWHEVGGYEMMESYKIDGILISNIIWDGKQIKSCKVHLEDEFGNEDVREISDMKSSPYKNLAITYEPVETITDVETKGNKVSFKMGDYQFVDAELLGNNKIGKCKLIHNGITEEIENLSEDSRFEQLSLITTVKLDESKAVPLTPSKLLTINGNKFELEADIVQTEEMKEIKYDINGKPIESTKNNGVAKAQSLTSVSEAVAKQKEFKDKPFKSIVIDEKGKVHIIDDFTTKYDVEDVFEQDNEVIPDLIGDTKAEIKKGKIEIAAKADNDAIDEAVCGAFLLCCNPFTIGIGIALLVRGAVMAASKPIKRHAKERKLTNYSLKDFQEETQDNVANKCEKTINDLYARCIRDLDACKAKYSQKEYEKKAEEIRRNFRHECNQEIVKLQILGGGAVDFEFDPNNKTKLTPMNHLAFLEYQRIQHEAQWGKPDDPRLPAMLEKNLKGMEGDALVLATYELLTKYGGRFSQQNAYSLKVDNIQLFLNEENKNRPADDKLSLEDYRKQIADEYNQGRMVWGSINDKLEAFKESVEYLREDDATRKKLLEKRKEALEKEVKNTKITSIEFGPRLDKDGNPVLEKNVQSILAFVEKADETFASGETKKKEKFTLNYIDTLSEEEKRVYASSTTINDVTAQKVDTVDMRKVAFASKANERQIKEINQQQTIVDRKVEGFAESTEKHLNAKEFEHVYQTVVSIEAEKEKFEEDCQKIKEMIDNIPFEELNEEAKADALRQLDEARVQYEKQTVLATDAKKALEMGYQKQVDMWALEEFAKRHKVEFETMKNSKLINVPKGLSDNGMRLWFYNEMRKNADKRDSYTREMNTYKVKNHVEENVDAEAFCEMYSDEYHQFIADNNAQGLDEETARCYFYAHCKSDTPAFVEAFKTIHAKKSKEKAKERVKNGELIKHEQAEQSQKTTKTASITAEPVSPSVSSDLDEEIVLAM